MLHLHFLQEEEYYFTLGDTELPDVVESQHILENGVCDMDERTYQEFVDLLKRISDHLEAIKLENRDSRRAESDFRRELLDAVGLVEVAIGR